MTTLFAFLFVIAVLIVVHELGHYWVARWCGVKVLRFSVGFGKPLWIKRLGPDQTEWVLSLIPLGGYVKMLDEREAETPIAANELPRAFNRQPVFKRILIVVAGPMANFLLAIAVYWTINLVGITAPPARLAQPAAASIAAQAGVTSGDVIAAINGQTVHSWNDVGWLLTLAAADHDPVMLTLRRGSEQRQVELPTQSTHLDETSLNVASQLGLNVAELAPVVGSVIANQPAQQAGLLEGDRILAVGDAPVETVRQLIELIRQHPDQALSFAVQRGDESFALNITPQAEQQPMPGGATQTVGKIGAGLAAQYDLELVRFGITDGVVQAVQRTWQTATFNLHMLGKLVRGQLSLSNLSGPVTIADYAGQAVKLGWIQYFALIAAISISLGVLNLLPIPTLDGGHLLYYLAEISLRKPLPQQVQEIGQRVGIALLLMLMSVALFNDIVRLIR
ncbi:MAG: RIP metalloprotease RseP [Burkholderiaceae bacterium]|nr:MAG: RIP metalloprotease RseP [Burkholderiaceae bacterium]